ncbi:MAG: hypothetical protein JSU69_00540 [Candidatus Zixiibacteriota bacterium]|nr:MAG: hypothetical protein JSU69_00540 [candidate division Zixibacteria bacterium]
MKRYLNITFCLLLLASMTFMGCGDDDDCPACPQDIENAIMFAQIYLASGSLLLYGQILCEDATMPDIDSVKLEGNDVALIEMFGTVFVGYTFSGSYLSGNLTSGDSVRIDIFTPHGNSVCELPVLAYSQDVPIIIDWTMGYPYDTVARNTDIEINWYHVVNAEWYAVSTAYYFGLGPESSRHDRSYTTDTTFTIPASETSMNGYYSIRIYSVTGPTPDVEGGNIIGGYVKGVVNSSMETGLPIIIGDGLGPPLSNRGADRSDPDFIEIYRELKNK